MSNKTTNVAHQQSKQKSKLESKNTNESNDNNLGKLLEKFKVKVTDKEFTIELFDNGSLDQGPKHYNVVVNGTLYPVEVETVAGELSSSGKALGDKELSHAQSAPLAKPVSSSKLASGKPLTTAVQAAPSAQAQELLDSKTLTAPMPGKILQIKVQIGDEVEAGQPLVILEAMKMENVMTAPASGTVKDIPIQPGVNVNQGDIMVVIE